MQNNLKSFSRTKLSLAIALNVSLIASVAAQSDELETIEISGATPLNNSTNTQTLFGSRQLLDAEDIENSNALSLPELLKSQLSSVNLNDVQNNPFQPDLQYRGFTASPLLGLPQGISVYLNGSRVNEAFGDTVNWDLIPLDAIDTVALYSGSNPVFGQNTLGGALALSTKTGFTYDQSEFELGAGSDGRQEIGLETGGNSGDYGYYININRYEEDGWRDFSPTEVQQIFTSLSYRGDQTSLDFNYMYADNEMVGNGASPIELLEVEGRSAVYTNPDQTNNELHHFSLDGEHEFNNSTRMSFNVFYRDTETSSINGDDSDYGACIFEDSGKITLCELEDDDDDDDSLFAGPSTNSSSLEDDDDDGALPEAGEDAEAVEFVGFEEGTAFTDISNVDVDEVDGTYNTGKAETDNIGISAQLAKQYKLSGKNSEFVLGAGYQTGDITYQADTTFGILLNDTATDPRAVQPIAGVQDAEARVRLDVDTEAFFIFFINSVELTDNITLNIAGRYNRDHIVMEDLSEDGDDSLDGNHRFNQFNPAVSLDINLAKNQNISIGYSQASRTPSPAELSCADEDDPCRLPNGFVADPPLDQVVTKTFEVNYTGTFNNMNLFANVFHSDSEDDIIFQQAGSVASRGYFINVDSTQRQGLELGLGHSVGDLSYHVSYNYLDATYESPFTSFSPQNPLGPNRQVNPGDTIPGQAEHLIKVLLDYQIMDGLNAGLEIISASDQYFRGDEANENQKVDGYEIVHLYASYDITEDLSIQLRVNNLLDEEYNTFGTYGEADEVLEDIYPDVEAPLFVGPAAPRQVAVKVRYAF